MPYDSIINRDGAESLMPEEFSKQIWQDVPTQSIVMGQMPTTRLPNMSRQQLRIPVLNSLPLAYFVNGDSGQKQTTSVSWADKFITAEEIAVIVPIPESVLDDADYDIFGQIKPLITAAIGTTWDKAVIKGTNKPSSWPVALLVAAAAAGHAVDLSALGGDLYAALLEEGGVLNLLEEDGFMPNGHVGALRMKAKLRGTRDANGQPIFNADPLKNQSSNYTLDGEPIAFPRDAVMDPSTELLLSGDWKQLVWAVRQDITTKILTEASIYDNSGTLVYALAQQDMVALRVVFRGGWALPNPITKVNEDANTRYPFSYLKP